jgi:hypothetical protein
MTSHPGFEDLSAYHDGEAPEWASHVAACTECRARLDELATLSAAVARPPEGPPAAGDPVARALAAAGGAAAAPAGEDAGEAAATPMAPVAPVTGDLPSAPSPLPEPAHPERARWLAWVTAASAAAVLVLVVGILALVNRSDGDRTTGSALTESERSTPGSEASPTDHGADMASDAPAPAAAPAPGPAPASAAAGGDLGEVGDAETLLARVGPSLGASREAAAAPRIVGTYPCESEARASAPGLGPVVYHATARVQGTPAVVLGFSPPGQVAPVTIQARAQSGCRLLLSASSP